MVDIEAAARATMVKEIVLQCTKSTNEIVHNMLEEMANQHAIDAASLREQNMRAQTRYEDAHREAIQTTHERMMSQQSNMLREEVSGLSKRQYQG
jgi:hypothetical protein